MRATREHRAGGGGGAEGCGAWDDDERAFLPFALNVLTFSGSQISDVTAFIARSTQSTEPRDYERFPEQPADPRRLLAAFGRFGLPERLD